jgi:hypothetical protein
MAGASKPPTPAPTIPEWDRSHMTLYWGNQIIKKFGRESSGQMRLLDEFQKFGWPPRIDVSQLAKDMGGKQWIADTETNLNRGLTVVQFHSDAANSCVCWGLR